MKKIADLFTPFLLIFLFCGVSSAFAATELQSIRHAVSAPGQEELRLQLSAESEPQVSVIRGNTPKIVFDFPDTIQKKTVPNTLDTNGAIVKRVRVGKHTDKVRVVCDLSSLKEVEHHARYDAAAQTLVIQFTGPQTITVADAAQPGQSGQSAPTRPDNAIAAPGADAVANIAKAPIKYKKRAAIAVQPPGPPIGQPPGEATEAAGEQETAGATPADGTSKEAAQTAPALGSSAAMLGVTSLFRPPLEPDTPDAPADTGSEETTPEGGTATENPPDGETASPAQPDPGAPLLESVTFDAHSPKGEMIIFKLNGFYPPEVQATEQNIPRIFCHFNDMRTDGTTLSQPVKAKDSRYVTEIRLQQLKNPDKIQATIELEPGRIYDLQQVFFKDENLFVLIINEAKR